jgi:hypothetical protein
LRQQQLFRVTLRPVAKVPLRNVAGQRNPWRAAIMRTAPLSLLVFSMAGCLAWGQAVNTTDEARKGRHLAILLCTGCHVVAPDQPYAPTLDPPAPSFAAIALRSGTTFDSLRHFLITTHQGPDNPKGMPNPDLADFQIRQIGAYLLSLRK